SVRCAGSTRAAEEEASSALGEGVERREDMRLEELLGSWLEIPARYRGVPVAGISCDSRKVGEGELFVAVSGELADGHRYIHDAIRAGASAIIGERRPSEVPIGGERRVPYFRVTSSREALGRVADAFFSRPSRELTVVGVTGTKGKTTTTWLLDSILAACGRSSALFGTVVNRYARRTSPSAQTTPSPLDLHGWLREHKDAGGACAVLEVSSHAIAQRR